MARAALSTQEVETFRQRMTAAALHLFASEGYAAVTMRSVAAALDVSAMTPYRYVESKDVLWAMVRAEAFRRFADSQVAAVAGQTDPVDRLVALQRAYVRFAQAQPDAYRVMFELQQDAMALPELERESRRALGPLLAATQDAVKAGVLQGDPLTLAHLLWASTHGLVSLHLANKLTLGRNLETLARAALEFQLPAAHKAARHRRPQ